MLMVSRAIRQKFTSLRLPAKGKRESEKQELIASKDRSQTVSNQRSKELFGVNIIVRVVLRLVVHSPPGLLCFLELAYLRFIL